MNWIENQAMNLYERSVFWITKLMTFRLERYFRHSQILLIFDVFYVVIFSVKLWAGGSHLSFFRPCWICVQFKSDPDSEVWARSEESESDEISIGIFSCQCGKCSAGKELLRSQRIKKAEKYRELSQAWKLWIVGNEDAPPPAALELSLTVVQTCYWFPSSSF